ncbi:MAG: NAD(P)H-binding protein, partial [Pseudomonadota bacterium]
MAHVLIFGASGGIGRETVTASLDAGHRVRGFARSAAAIQCDSDGFEKWPGDATNKDDVSRALAGVDIVVQALGVRTADLFKPVDLFSKATRLLVEAMKQQGVGRLIAVTGFGAGDSREAIGALQQLPFRFLLGRAYDDKDVQEKIIKDSGLDWTIVRPGILTQGPKTGQCQVLLERADWRNGVISRADVAK